MSHLSTERLAALADEQPTGDEASHLGRCPDCARELAAHRSLLTLAGAERESMGVPLTRWDTLSARLRAEGLIPREDARDVQQPGSRSGLRALPMQIAAALLLVAGGVVLGRASAGAALVPGGIAGNEAVTTRVTDRTPSALPTTFSSVEEANRWRALYAEGYQSAVSFLATNDSTSRSLGTPAVMRTRLSALDRVSHAMREALNDAPYDPVINDFYLHSFGQREATLRQLNTVLPENVRLNSF